jgi:hypothetical protein
MKHFVIITAVVAGSALAAWQFGTHYRNPTFQTMVQVPEGGGYGYRPFAATEGVASIENGARRNDYPATNLASTILENQIKVDQERLNAVTLAAGSEEQIAAAKRDLNLAEQALASANSAPAIAQK